MNCKKREINFSLFLFKWINRQTGLILKNLITDCGVQIRLNGLNFQNLITDRAIHTPLGQKKEGRIFIYPLIFPLFLEKRKTLKNFSSYPGFLPQWLSRFGLPLTKP
jgi:hypothetical protein